MSEDVLKEWGKDIDSAIEYADVLTEKLVTEPVGDWVIYTQKAEARRCRYLRCIRDIGIALRAERERVAELEPDARLGRMVREMPLGAMLRHRNRPEGGWFFTPDCEHFWTFCDGNSPEAALEAAREGET